MIQEREKLIKECEEKLIDLKYRYQFALSSTCEHNKQGNVFRERMSLLLPEIYAALDRIKVGEYGYCELTGDEIDSFLLASVPWVRSNIDAVGFKKAS